MGTASREPMGAVMYFKAALPTGVYFITDVSRQTDFSTREPVKDRETGLPVWRVEITCKQEGAARTEHFVVKVASASPLDQIHPFTQISPSALEDFRATTYTPEGTRALAVSFRASGIRGGSSASGSSSK